MYSGCDTLSLQILFVYFWHRHPYFILQLFIILVSYLGTNRSRFIHQTLSPSLSLCRRGWLVSLEEYLVSEYS